MVYKFFHYPYSEDDYENTLYQYLFCHSFLIGWRVPSEICELTTNDVVINDNGTGCIVITEVKKHDHNEHSSQENNSCSQKHTRASRTGSTTGDLKSQTNTAKTHSISNPMDDHSPLDTLDTNSATTENKSGKISSPTT